MTTKALDQFVSFNKDNSEAFVKSSTAAYKGIEVLTKTAQELATKTASKGDAALKSLLAVKSPTELADLQTRLTREAIEASLADSRKLVELASSVYSAAIAPLNERITALQALVPASFGKKAA